MWRFQLGNVLRNFFILALGDIGSKLIGFATIAYMARILGPDNFGLVSIGLSILGYMVLVSSPGVHLFGTRSVASGDEKYRHIVMSINGLRLAISVLLLAGTVLLYLFAGTGSPIWIVIVLFSLTLIPLSISLVWFFQGKEQMGVITWSRLILNCVYLLLLFLLVRGRDDVAMVPVAFFAGNTAASIYLMIAGYRTGSFTFRGGPGPAGGVGMGWKSLLRQSLPMGLGSTLAQIAFNFPTLLLGFMLGAGAAGQYGAAMRIVFAFMLLDRVMSTVFFPLVARVRKTDRERLTGISNQFMRMVMVITLPACLLSFALAPELISAVYGPDYGEASDILRVLVWFFFFTSLNTLFLYGLMGAGQENRYARIMLIGITVQLGLTTALIFPLGAIGVATGFVAGEIFISILAYHEYRKIARVVFFRPFLQPAVSGLAAGLFLLFRPMGGLIAPLAVALILYLIVLIIIGGVTSDDVALLRQER